MDECKSNTKRVNFMIILTEFQINFIQKKKLRQKNCMTKFYKKYLLGKTKN